ncbi:XrtA/PEP-CTERM system histidine kinase PrsK [Pelovirga terrestris]|uniref:histidine kinase n=1 Tax=Pelovirga terrestris TaxID=2771352 RepID=A0A8J6QL83_9BACT|nr:XrtA/PEP-CTERM system histidine kinase PrsK [Pelovirga terrestris]MBD1399112.1 PEP-CTERM system histidine kinase PrsK [Pelovirga terrestris]
MLTEILLWLTILLCPLAVLVLLARRCFTVATLFFIAALISLAWLSYIDLSSLRWPERLYGLRNIGLPLEVVVVFACYFYTKTSFRDNSRIYRGVGFWLAILLFIALFVYALVTPSLHLIFSPDFADELILFLTTPGFFIYLILMLVLVFGLVQLERTLAGLHELQRWKVKLEVLASGLLMAAFALYFSHSLLFRSINVNYLSIRSVAVAVAVALFCYSRLARGDGARLALSRGIAHRSFVLLLVGGYLILLGTIGGGLRYLNIGDAKVLINILLLVGSLALAAVFLSERLRRKLKVLLQKNFYQSKYDYREQWERFSHYATGGGSLTEIQNAILDHFCSVLACKGAALYLYDDEQNHFAPAASFNFPRDWRPFLPDDPVIGQFAKKDWILNLRDDSPDLQGSLLETICEPDIFLIVPLFFDDELAGFILLGEQVNPDELLSFEDYDMLRMLARQSIATIQGLRLADQLVVARELAAIGKVSTFVLHDLKNQVSGLSLLMENAAEHIENPEFQQDMLETIGNTVSNMKSLITRLKGLKEKPQLAVSSVPLSNIIAEAAGTIGGTIHIDGDQDILVAVDEEEIYKVIVNLLVNAREATLDGRSVDISYGADQLQAWIKIKDAGCGMSAEFIRTHLFKPFETTKKHGFGIGLYQCQQIVTAHNGEILVASREGEGTVFTVRLPLAFDMRPS